MEICLTILCKKVHYLHALKITDLMLHQHARGIIQTVQYERL